MNYQDINANAVDRLVESGWTWGMCVDHKTWLRAREGDWQVLLTPTKPVPRDWLGDLRGRRVLGLACGGGQQMPIFAAVGAICTVLDYSPKQLENDRRVAKREGYDIEIVRADMTKPLPFGDDCFDLIFHPVSNCFIEEVEPVWRECFRVLKPGGALLAGFDSFINYAVDFQDESFLKHRLPFNPLKDASQMADLAAEGGTVEFSHTLEEQIGGQLRAGFRLLDLYEDTNGSGFLHDMNIPAYIATRSVKPLP